MQQPQQQRFQQTPQPKLPEKKSNLWLIIIVIIILLALLWPVFRKSKAPADLSDLTDETASSTDETIDLSDDVSVLSPNTVSPGRVQVTPATTVASPALAPTSMTLKVFFGYGNKTPESTQCGLTFFANRRVPATSAPARAALTKLIEGPTTQEAALGFFSLINPGATIKELTINNGVARVNFNANLVSGAAAESTCVMDGIRAQVVNTLKQFPTVRSVEILVNGVAF